MHVAGARLWWPGVKRKIYVDERDVVLAHALKSTGGDKVVGIVGLAHLAGIRRHWHQETNSLVSASFREPPRNVFPQALCFGLLVSFPALMRIRSKAMRRTACGLNAILVGSIIGSSGRFSFID